MSRAWTMGATAVIVAFTAAAAAGDLCQLDRAVQAELAQRLALGDAAGVLAQAQEELGTHPDCWAGNRLKTDALMALGRPYDAAAWLIERADRDRRDAHRIEALIELYRRTGDWRSTSDLIARIEELPEPGRTITFRSLFEALQGAKENKLAEDVLARMLAVPSDPSAGSPRPPGESCRLDAAAFAGLEQRITDGDAEEALGRARDELETHPSCWFAHRLQADALVALGEPGVAGELLLEWANRDRKDPARIAALIAYSRKTGNWEAPHDLNSRIGGLPEPVRTRMLRDLLDELYEAKETRRAERVLGLLLMGAPEAQFEAIRRALEAATSGDIPAMWGELPSFPSAESSPALRAETLIVLARRVASACVMKSCSSPLKVPTPAPETLPRLVSKVEPHYPDGARRERIEGSMILFLAVLPSGEPIVLGSARETDRRFLRAGAEAVAQWRYEPARVAGEAVSTHYTVRVDFRLR